MVGEPGEKWGEKASFRYPGWCVFVSVVTYVTYYTCVRRGGREKWMVDVDYKVGGRSLGSLHICDEWKVATYK